MDTNPRLTIAYARTTRSEINQIWDYNEKKYGRQHAAAYIEFLQDGIDALATTYADDRAVEGFPHLQGITLKRSPRAHGHVVIYRVDQAAQLIRILHVYHTRQDIQGRLKREGQ